MNIMKNLSRSFLLACMISGVAQSQEFSKVGTSSGQFLKIPIGAKAVSMAGTFASVADDYSALYWNAAGVAALDQFEIGATRTEWIAGITHNYLGMVLPMGENGVVGFSANQVSSGDIEVTTIQSPKGTGTFYNAADLALSASYSRFIMDRVSAAFTVKYISERIANTSAQTVVFDVGVLLRTNFYNMRMGLSFQNFGPSLQMTGSDLIKTVDLDPKSEINPVVEADLKTQTYALPRSYRASLSMPLIGKGGVIESELSSFSAAIDGVHRTDSRERYSIGGEYGFSKTFFVRGGYVFNTDEEGLTLGAGLMIHSGERSVTFDYAYASFGVFTAVHVFSLGIRL